MDYIKGTIYTGLSDLEQAEAMLMGIGIDSLEVGDPRDIEDLMNKKNEYDWDYVDSKVMAQADSEPYVSFYLSDDEEGKRLDAAAEKLAAEQSAEGKSWRYVREVVCDDDWKDKWKEYFKPAHITDRVVVKPTWEPYTPAEGELVIEIDPGAAFGTGTHPTTTGCITLMEKFLRPGMSVLDVGCGSGILSIAAGLMKAGDVLGIEIDPVAVEIGKENVELNGLSSIVRVQEGDLTKGVDYKADIVVANLMADLVKMLTGDVKRHMKQGGVYISSGILLELKDELCEFIEGCGFEIVDVYENEKDGGWCAIAAKLK
jgi:ribosomal protein L11 methyltransferase